MQIQKLKNKNGRTMLLSKCAVCCSKKSQLMKEQKAKGILNSLVLNLASLVSLVPLSKIPLFGDILF